METRWLEPREQDAWRAYLIGTLSLYDVLDRQLQRDSGINHAYYEILVNLSEAPAHELRMSELADRLLSSRSRLSHAVARLEERGWVKRVACPTDRRGQIARLTPVGYQALVEAAPGHVAAVRRHLVDVLSPEQLEQLAAICRVISLGTTAPAEDMGGKPAL